MFTFGNLDHSGGDRLETLHEENIDAIEDDPDNIPWLSDCSDLGNISLFDRLDGIFSLSQVWQSSLKLLVRLISLNLNKGSLLLASLCDSIDFFSFDVSFFVLLIKFLEELVGCLSGSVEFCILFLQDNLHGFDVLSGLSELVKTFSNILLFLINSLVLCGVEKLVSSDEGQIGLWSDIDVSTHLLEVDSADLIDHLVDLAHVHSETLFGLFRSVDLEVVYELR